MNYLHFWSHLHCYSQCWVIDIFFLLIRYKIPFSWLFFISGHYLQLIIWVHRSGRSTHYDYWKISEYLQFVIVPVINIFFPLPFIAIWCILSRQMITRNAGKNASMLNGIQWTEIWYTSVPRESTLRMVRRRTRKARLVDQTMEAPGIEIGGGGGELD